MLLIRVYSIVPDHSLSSSAAPPPGQMSRRASGPAPAAAPAYPSPDAAAQLRAPGRTSSSSESWIQARLQRDEQLKRRGDFVVWPFEPFTQLELLKIYQLPS